MSPIEYLSITWNYISIVFSDLPNPRTFSNCHTFISTIIFLDSKAPHLQVILLYPVHSLFITCRYSYSFLSLAHHFYSLQFLLWLSLLSPHCNYFTLHSEYNPSSFKSTQQLLKKKNHSSNISFYYNWFKPGNRFHNPTLLCFQGSSISYIASFLQVNIICFLCPINTWPLLLPFIVSSSTQIVLPYILCVNFKVV